MWYCTYFFQYQTNTSALQPKFSKHSQNTLLKNVQQNQKKVAKFRKHQKRRLHDQRTRNSFFNSVT